MAGAIGMSENSSVDVTQSQAVCMWGLFPGVLGPLSALLPGSGPLEADLWDVNWLSCPLTSGWMVQWEPEQEICAGKRVRGKVLPWLFSSRVAIALLGVPLTQTPLTLVPIATLSLTPLTYLQKRWDTLSPVLGACSPPCGLPVPCS